MNNRANELPDTYNGILTGGLNNLLEVDSEARDYYLGLPKEKRDMLFTRQNDINTFDALRKAAEE